MDMKLNDSLSCNDINSNMGVTVENSLLNDKCGDSKTMDNASILSVNPKNSYGLIAYTLKNNDIYILGMKRRKSYAYQAFVDADFDEKTIENLISKMYTEEVKYLLSLSENLSRYENTLQSSSTSSYISQSATAIQKEVLESSFRKTVQDLWFSKIKYKIKGEQTVKILKDNVRKYRTIFESVMKNISNKSSNGINHDLVWGFPKGKKRRHEDGMSCAYREFVEETKMYSHVNFINDTNSSSQQYNSSSSSSSNTISSSQQPHNLSCVEISFGEDNIQYTNIYYLGYIRSPPTIYKKKNYSCGEDFITFEIGDLKWIKLSNIGKYFDSSKRGIIDYMTKKIPKHQLRSKSV
jgi:hypothetical protein